jgi:hypothetical protein
MLLLFFSYLNKIDWYSLFFLGLPETTPKVTEEVEIADAKTQNTFKELTSEHLEQLSK